MEKLGINANKNEPMADIIKAPISTGFSLYLSTIFSIVLCFDLKLLFESGFISSSSVLANKLEITL